MGAWQRGVAESLQAELTGDERAIRHLLGEAAALSSRVKRAEAIVKLEQQRQQHTVANDQHPAVSGHGGAIPHGDRFPDVSAYQPSVDWQVVAKAGSVRVGRLAVTKVTEGTGWTDQYGNLRLRHMKGVGMPHRGAYHFAHPSQNPTEQANHFLAVAHENGVTLTDADIVVCDLEVSDGEAARIVASCAREFAAAIRQHVPSKLWLYGGGPFLQEYRVTLDGYDGHWLAAYVGDPFRYMIFGRGRTIAWQFTDGKFGPLPHICPGIGAGDLSIIL